VDETLVIERRMKTRTAWTIALLSLAVQAALAAAWLPLPPSVLAVLAAAVLVLSPGSAWLELLGARPPGGAWLAPSWALGLGIAWNAVLLAATFVLRAPFLSLATITMPITALLWAIVIARSVGARRAARGATAFARVEAWPPLKGVALGMTLLAAALTAVYAARFGTPLHLISDSPDHVGTLRRMIEHGVLFPNDAFYRGAGTAGVDPRKFLWHGELALMAHLARVSPLQIWRNLPALLSPLLVLAAAMLGMLLAGGAGAAVSAWALMLTYGGSMMATPLRETVFAAKLGDQLALAASVALLADLTRPARGSRAAAVALAIAAAATHVFAAFQFTLVIGALAAGLILRDRGIGTTLRRLTVTALAMAAAVLPFVIWQVARSPQPVNMIHLEPQGLLTLWSGVRVVSPGVLWDWMGATWWLFPLFAVPLWREGRKDPAALFLLTTACGVAFVLFCPPLVAALEPRVGYLLMRVAWMTPIAGLAGWALPRLSRGARAASPRTRATAWAMLALVALAFAPAVLDAARVMIHGREIAAAERERTAAAFADDVRVLERDLGAGSVVLSDPLTSYVVPMLSGQYVVTLLDQHSSPSDAHALDRLMDARDALDPYADWNRTREVIDRYGVTAIVLNARMKDVPTLDYWTPRHDWFTEARARLDRHPSAFAPLLDRGDFVVYGVHRAALDSLEGSDAPRPFVSRYVPGRDGIARRIGRGIPALLGLGLSPALASPGDTLHGVIAWRSLEHLPAGSYQVAVRFDRDLPGGFHPPAFISKPARKLIEKWRHERYRFRVDHLPVGGDFGVDLWQPGDVVRDSFEIAVPADVAPGDYQVRVRMIRQPHYPNFRLSDYFFDDDYYAGVVAGQLRLVNRAPVRRSGS
jgi:hypothetical protein